MSDKIIQITEMNKWFGDFQVLKNINLEVEKNKKKAVVTKMVLTRNFISNCLIINADNKNDIDKNTII